MGREQEQVTAEGAEPRDLARRRYAVTMLVAGGASALVYLSLLGGLLRAHLFSAFYDIQARAFLDGDLAVPGGTLGIEAFHIDGSDFMYFPPGPALLRMPLLAVTDRFDGRLTGLSMLAAWIVTASLVSLLLWRLRCILRGRAPLGRAEATAYGLFLVAVSAGSVVLFLASIPWVYHEAYAWAIAMVLGALFCLLGLVQQPSTGRVVTTGLFTLGAALTRTPAGWACAGAVLLAALWFLSGRRGPEVRRLGWRVVLAGVLPLVLAGAVNWAKFGHPILFPLEDQVFTSVSQHRRDALAANGGDLVSPEIFFSTVVAYFRPDGIRFTSIFPFITLPPESSGSYVGGYLDQTYRTGSVTNFMPVLLGLAVWGVITTFRPRGRPGVDLLRLPLLGAMAIPGAVMFYGYIAHRYTSEFVPLLVVGGAIGLVDVSRRLLARPRRVRIAVLGALALAVGFSVVANLAVSVHSQSLAHPGGRLNSYLLLQERLSGHTGDPLARYVEVSETLPPTGRADELRILGDCRALYVGTGVDTDPWVEAEISEMAWQVEVADLPPDSPPGRGRAVLATVNGYGRAELVLERRNDEFRLVLDDVVDSTGDWFDVAPGGSFRVSVDPAFPEAYIVTGGPAGRGVVFIRKRDVDEDLSAVPNTLSAAVDDAEVAALGVEVETLAPEPFELCRRLLALEEAARSA